MKRDFLKLFALLLAVCLLFTGCGYRIGQAEITEPDNSESGEEKEKDGPSAITAMEGEVTNPADDVFTLCWHKEKPLNPYENTSGENEAVMSLVYEGLFAVSPDFQVEPRLCSGYSVTGTTCTFYIKPGLTFHDGDELNATDAVYSTELAMESERYAGRLSIIESVEYVSELCFRLILKAENRSIAALLDFPIVLYGTGEDKIPVGSGPYEMNYSEDTLTAFDSERFTVPTETIYLYDSSDAPPSAAMSRRKADMILYDTSKGNLNVYIDHETRYYDTTVLQYIGFNMGGSVLSRPEVRHAISYLVDREAITSVYPAGSITSAPLILSPLSPGYDDSLEKESRYSAQTFTSILSERGAGDSDGDGWLEYGGSTMDFRFIVCNSSESIVAAAEEAADAMGSVGMRIDFDVLGRDAYIEALENGNYDIYYAEVRLPANFDLSEILGSEGSLNYGGYWGYDSLLSAYLNARNEEEKTAASKELCEKVFESAPVIPVCYRKNAVAIPRAFIEGLDPGQQDLFWGLDRWNINYRQED